MESFTTVSQDRADILAIVTGLEGQVDTTVQLRETLETDLDSIQQRLSEEIATRARLEEQIKSLEMRTSQADELQKDLAYARDEHVNLCKKIAENKPKLEAVTRQRDSLAMEVESIRKKLSNGSSVRIRLEEQVKTLEVQGPQTEQLRNEISAVTEERNKLGNMLTEMRQRLEGVNRERDLLTRELTSAQAYVREQETKRKAFEAQSENFKGKDAEVDRIRNELSDTNKIRQDLSDKLRDMTNRLEVTETSKEAIENDLTAANEAIRSLRGEVDSLQGELTGVDANEADIRSQYARQTSELIAAKEQLQNETAARRQAEEMVTEIKLRLTSLAQKQPHLFRK